MSRRIESLMIGGPAGRIEALIEEPGGGEPVEAALVCHPHPLHGGTLHNKVVHRLARGLRRAGCVVLRFNFRGVNLSEGEHDHGHGEVDDARASLAVLRERYPELPFTLAGFSFGSRVAIRLAAQLAYPAPRRVVAVGFPTVYRNMTFVHECPHPRIFVHSTHDEYGPQADLQKLYDAIPGPKRLIWIEAQDHFFRGALDKFENAIVALA